MITSIIKGLAKIQGDIEPFVTHKGVFGPPYLKAFPPAFLRDSLLTLFPPLFFTLRYFRSTPLQTA